jgi:hypothetical protein
MVDIFHRVLGVDDKGYGVNGYGLLVDCALMLVFEIADLLLAQRTRDAGKAYSGFYNRVDAVGFVKIVGEHVDRCLVSVISEFKYLDLLLHDVPERGVASYGGKTVQVAFLAGF